MQRLDEAEAKHPDGATFTALVEEVGEVAKCLEDKVAPERTFDELLDVCAVSMRLAMEWP